MRLVLLHGPPASGKLTIGRVLAERTGFALFHNHLVVDAALALFEFGSEPFVRMREALLRMLLTEAVSAGRNTIFTFAPEPTVTPGFVPFLLAELRAAGAEVFTVALTIDPEEQDRRLISTDRTRFGKLADVTLLTALRPSMMASAAAMPAADLTIDTTSLAADSAAAMILERMSCARSRPLL